MIALFWEWIKFIGLFGFIFIMLLVNLSYIHGEGKGWDYNTISIHISFPKSRLLHWILFQLFYCALFILTFSFLFGGMDINASMPDWGYPVTFLILGLTNLLGAPYLWGDSRKGKWTQKFDKVMPLCIRVWGAIITIIAVSSFFN